MRFLTLPLPGARLVELEPIEDERGFFARAWCPDEFSREGLDARVAACNVSFNRRALTLRGMHYQAAPHGEAKLVRCTAGAIHDVIVDLRPSSPTYCRWHAVELSAGNRLALYVPAGFAHGFLTMSEASEVLYLMSRPHMPEAARGVRWDDPHFGIEWPAQPRIISRRDEEYPDYEPDGPGA
ncbi:MAG: dTDP-4-dehydrorhamnose 3,5-epimerase [Phycisphaerales bacterium]|jgi:dTDP-4-dehydrorhamnose 3,5-epimerase|nr:dTDP-4-dehydrorhamnose 3,5-epimerase [Phycisphaerales bacterium]